MKLVIVESPNKTKKIASYLGNGWKVMASFGHIRDLPLKEIGVAAPDFKPQYAVSSKSRAHVSKLRDAAKNASEVYLATDPDREGEAISWHLEQVLKLKSPKRVTFQEITKNAVTRAINEPRSLDYQLVAAANCRRVADRLVGYLVSPALSGKAGQRLSAGRVQSPAVRLVVEREREITNFAPIKYFVVRLYFETNGLTWFAEWDANSQLPQGITHLQDAQFAQQLSQIRNVTLETIAKSKSRSAAPAPFTTSTLQQAASVSLGLNPKKTMQVAQALFEEGLITYHRTDSRNLSDEAIIDVRSWLKANGYLSELPESPNRWGSKQGSQEAHEAIRPTTITNQNPSIDDPVAQKLYQMIWFRTVASQMQPAIFEVTKYNLRSNESVNGKTQLFVAKGRIMLSPGWMRLVKKDQTDESDDAENASGDDQQLPKIAEGSKLIAHDGKLLERLTKPPQRYTEASLIKKLEAEGIGRPSTYASILDNIINRSYVEVHKKKLHATDTGMTVSDALVGKFKFMEIPFTRGLEASLDDIASGKADYLKTISGLYQGLSSELGLLQNAEIKHSGVIHPCPECGKKMNRIPGKNKKFFWGCSGYPECKTTMADSKGKPVAKKSQPVVEGPPCPACEKPMILRKGKRGSFYGCSGYPSCTQTMPVETAGAGNQRASKSYSNSSAGEKCPSCKKGSLILRTVKNGKNVGKEFYGCANYPNCNHFAWANR